MKIVHTYPYSAPVDENIPRLASGLVTGGGETYPYRLSLEQAKIGHQVTYLTARQLGILKNYIRKDHWQIRYLRSLKPLSVQFAIPLTLFPRLLFGNYDIYFGHQLPTVTTFITALVAKLKGKPMIVQYLGFRPDINPKAKILSKINSKLITKMIMPNNYAANFFKGYLDDKQMVTVPYAIDLDYYQISGNAKRPASMKDSQKKYILYVGRLLSSKGIDVLIKAFNLELKKNKNLRLIIVGKGPFDNYLKDLVKDLKLTDNVAFTGFVPDDELVYYYTFADIFVLPSVYYDCFGNYHPEPEAFGLVLAEAMNCNTPVIASRVGGIPSWIEDGYNGLLFESGNEKELAQLINKLLTSKTLVNKLTANAKRALNEKHSLSKVASQIDKIIHKL